MESSRKEESSLGPKNTAKEAYGYEKDDQYAHLLELMHKNLTRKMKRRMIKKEDKWGDVITKVLINKNK
jgi:hypothetical protein